MGVLDVGRGVPFEGKRLFEVEDDDSVVVARQHRVFQRAEPTCRATRSFASSAQVRVLLVDDLARPRQHLIADVVVDRDVAFAGGDDALRQRDDLVAEVVALRRLLEAPAAPGS